MAFPATSVLDDFNRADGAPGASWTAPVQSGYTTMAVISNALGPAAAFKSNYWATQFAGDQEVYVTVSVMPTNSCDLVARLQSPGVAGRDCYLIIFFSSGDLYLQRVVNNARTTLQTLGGAGTFTTGDVLGLRCVGDQISGWKNGTQLGTTQTDSTITGAGYIGLQVENTTAVRFDNFGGGVTSTTYAGATSLALTDSGTTQGSRKTFGVVSRSETVGVVTAGVRTVFGAVEVGLGYGEGTYGGAAYGGTRIRVDITTSGTTISTKFGATSLTLQVARVTSGKLGARSSSAVSLTDSISTLGSRLTRSSSTLPLTLAVTTQGQRTLRGVSTMALLVSVVTDGRAQGNGVSSLTLAVSRTTVGKLGAFATVSRPQVVAITTAGAKAHYGVASLPLVVQVTTLGTRTLVGSTSLPLVVAIVTRSTAQNFITLDEILAGRIGRSSGEIDRPMAGRIAR